MEYRHTRKWFTHSEIRQTLLQHIFIYAQNRVLEIGCYEGLSSVFFADNILDNPGSSLTCVDPFLSVEHNDHSQYLSNNEESNFDFNIAHCKNAEKIKVRKITSDAFFKENISTYNFIYIDGCHECDYITRDMENSFAVLERGGIMWMDDYRGSEKITQTMNEFLEKYAGQYTILHTGYQLAIRKL
jgi:predicted O-methyltransferase YrrM